MSLSRTRNLFNGCESPSSRVGRGRHRSLALLLLFVVVGRNEAAGQEGYSIIRLEPGGPGGPVTGLCFAPDSKVLYVAGWSKTVQVWDRNEATGLLDQNRQATLRVPLGLGVDGVINAMALSADGQWLAVGGQGVIADAAGFFRQGYTVPYDLLPDEMKMDRGQITVFRTSQPAQVRRLRGHLDSIQALPSPRS